MSVSGDELRRMALALPEATEEDHHGKPSFRVGGKIFATFWDSATVNVSLDEDGIRTAVHDLPATCTERWWGKRLSAVAVDLGAIAPADLEALLADAWEHKAPARLRPQT